MTGSRSLIKLQIISTTSEMLFHKPIDKITVTDICNRISIDRQIFYYYFKDKYDVINNLYQSTADQIIKDNNQENWKVVVTLICDFTKENRKIFTNALRSESQNSYIWFLVDYSYNMNKRVMEDSCGKKLSNDELFLLKSYSYGAAWMTKEWANEGMKRSAKSFAERIFTSMPIEIRKCCPNIVL